MNIHTYGADQRLEFCREYILKRRIRAAKSIALLPIPTSKDGITLNGSREPLSELAEKLSSYDVVVGYGIAKEYRALLSERGAVVIDVSRDEEYLAENASLTAVGTVGRILTEERSAPCDLSFGIIGYGRIGQRLLHILMFLSGKVTVFTSKRELRQELCMLGISGVDSLSFESPEAAAKLSELDILINTAPARLISDNMRDSLAKVRIIELAPGDNLPEGVAVERFSAVPSFMYPRSAGIALGKSVLRMLGEMDIKT
ncbi:MAG: hypothetical protein IJD79_01820 [Clostridia bacterium]|nr:hypothetical protein [Clostridia bacterium]